MNNMIISLFEEWAKSDLGELLQKNEKKIEIKLKNEDRIGIKIENISCRVKNKDIRLTTTGTKIKNDYTIYSEKNDRFVWLGQFTNTDKNNIPNKYRIFLDNHIFAIEPMDDAYMKYDSDSYDISLCVRRAESYFAAHPQKGIYSEKKNGERNSFKVILIRIKDDKQFIFDYLDDYLMSSDSRTYSQSTYNTVRIEFAQSSSEEKKVSKWPYNLLVYGAPGTGKSFYIDSLIKDIASATASELKSGGTSNTQVNTTGDQQPDYVKEFQNQFVQRVTFYEDYSYENFVGSYKPIPKESDESILKLKYLHSNVEDEVEGTIQGYKIGYEYEAGPFIDAYIKAKNDPNHNYFLIMEEINRAKAASVFGDIFQLLDRKNGKSQYTITPEPALKKYLEENLKNPDIPISMSLPDNLYLWSTMNSADQGVFLLDSAFKRRWSFVYKDINSHKEAGLRYICLKHGEGNTITSKYIEWDTFRNAINDVILKNERDEDRCIGPWYFSDDELLKVEKYTQAPAPKDEIAENPLMDKLIAYLRQDVFRMDAPSLFKGEYGKYNMSALRKQIREDKPIEKILELEIDSSEWVDVIRFTSKFEGKEKQYQMPWNDFLMAIDIASDHLSYSSIISKEFIESIKKAKSDVINNALNLENITLEYTPIEDIFNQQELLDKIYIKLGLKMEKRNEINGTSGDTNEN